MPRLALIAPLVLTAAAEAGPGFWLVGMAPSATDSYVGGLSQDGLVAVGYSDIYKPPKFAPGFRWTSAGGREDWGLLPEMPSYTLARGVSGDGSAIVGWMGESIVDPPYYTQHAFRLVGTGPIEDLGLLPNEQRSYATGISGDGQIVVGTCEHGQSDSAGKAFRWTADGGMKSLGFLKANSIFSKAHAVSRDGATIVGMSQTVQSDRDAYRWTQAEGMVELPDLPGKPYEWSEALGVNADGSVIVGYSPAADKHYHAVRWVKGQIEDLTPNLKEAYARAMDDSGDVIGGNYGGQALIWTPATGAMSFEDFLAGYGIEVPSDYELDSIYAISGDGLTFAGVARNVFTNRSEGFVATISAACDADCDSSGELDIDDFICFQTLFGLGDPAADCDGSGELDIDDFICFQTAFGLGCP